MTKTTTPTTNTGVAFSGEPRPLTCDPLLFILAHLKTLLCLAKTQPKGFGGGTYNYLCHFTSRFYTTEIMSSLPRGMISSMNPTDERESSVTTGGKKEQTRPGGEFLVVAAKQKAHSNVDPSLLWYGSQACWSSVCVCAPVQTSSTLATGYEGGTNGGQGVSAYHRSRWADCTQRWREVEGEQVVVLRPWLSPSSHDGAPG